MARTGNHSSPHAALSGDGRLNSWKAIAAYLKRDVSTVQRWEKSEGLPVHRHGHRRGATAYAYRSEIDAWLTSRRVPPGGSPRSSSSGPSLIERRLPWVAMIALGTLGVSIWMLWGPSGPLTHSILVDDRLRILVTDFAGGAVQRQPAEAFNAIIGGELSGSASLIVVPREEVIETLERMRQPADAPIDLNTAMQIARRDGQIHAVVHGRIENLDDSEVLILELRDPRTGIVVAAASTTIDEKRELVETIAEISARVREAAEEQMTLLTPPADTPLEQVTTASLEALELYSKAVASSMDDDDPTAGDNHAIELLLREAISHDEEFASAKIMLAWFVHNQGPRTERHLPIADEVMELVDSVSIAEGYFIRGSYHLMHGEYSRAADEFMLLVALHPDHYWGTNNLVRAFDGLGKRSLAAQYSAVLSDLRPANAAVAALAARRLARMGDIDRAKAYVQRAAASLDNPALPETRRSVARNYYWQAELAIAERLWSQGRMSEFVEELVRYRNALGSLEAEERNVLAQRLANNYLMLGQVNTAADVLAERGPGFEVYQVYLFISSVTGQPVNPADFGMRPGSNISTISDDAFWLARNGRLAEASRNLDRARAIQTAVGSTDGFGLREYFERVVQVAEAELLAARGDHRAAEALFKDVLDNALPREPRAYLAAESLSSLLAMRGDIDQAIAVLERWGGSQRRPQIDQQFVATVWMRNRLKLSRLLRDIDPGRADELEAELRLLLAYADEDHYIVRVLNQPDTRGL